MPAGNDSADDYRELADRYPGSSNAETLVKSNRRRYPAELRRALRTPVDEEATAALDPKAVAKAAGIHPDSIVSATARGDYVVFAYVDGGRTRKSAVKKPSASKPAARKRGGSKPSARKRK